MSSGPRMNLVSSEEVATSGGFKRPREVRKSGGEQPALVLAREKRAFSSLGGGKSSHEGLSDSPVYRSDIERAILRGGLRKNNPLRLVFEQYEKTGEAVPVVEYVPQPLDGNKIYLRPKGSGLTDRLIDAQHWGKGENVHPSLERNAFLVRRWKCEGGHACRNKACWFVKDLGGRLNTIAFDKTTEGVWYCNFCHEEASSTGECEALRFQVKEKEKDAFIAHVHYGRHNHGTDITVSQEVRERFAIHAMKTAASDLTPAKYTQCQVREALFAKMEENASSNDNNLEE
jgi:hypothetical protein